MRSLLASVPLLICCSAWCPPKIRRPPNYRIPPNTRLWSTPFEADFYEKPEQSPSSSQTSPLKVPPDTQLVVGLNKYSHDTSLCAADASSGQVLFALSKERISRRKHDSGNVATLVETCLECLDLQLENIQTVVMNNHHHRIRPLEDEGKQRHMEWEAGLGMNGGRESGYEEPENTLPDAKQRLELSHHLAHAYSTATQAPFASGLCIVMDGMGETYRTMRQAVQSNDTTYISDLLFGLDSFQCIPANIDEEANKSPFDFREAESVYQFRKLPSGGGNASKIDIWPIFKRFTKENSAPTLENFGFENMDSLGAVYSRASTHIFADWNSCGKVMGLAPWIDYKWTNDDDERQKTAVRQEVPIMSGSLYVETGESALKLQRDSMEGEPYCVRNDPDLFDTRDGSMKRRYDFDDDETPTNDKDGKRSPSNVALDAISLASRVQDDLETVAIDFVRHFQQKSGEKNLCLAGGVALNSVLNGRLMREIGFDDSFISPYPGDDGIAVGCCAFGLFGNKRLGIGSTASAEVWSGPLSPYLGPQYSDDDLEEAIENARPWLEVDTVRNEDKRMEIMAREVESGGVIAWYRSRSEVGPRALGHRSILADPRKKGLVRFINEKVKRRESFRPFAPSVLAEEASEWFDIASPSSNASPFMSITAMVKDSKRLQIPAVTHVDGSSRLQTVTYDNEPTYHKFISKFYELTGVPLVLNTSFNTLPGEPIVESPFDAIRAFLFSMGSIEMLVMEDYIIKRKKPDLRKLLGEASKDGVLAIEPSFPKRSGPAFVESSFELLDGESDENSVITKTRVKMPDRPMHGNKNEWFELLDELEGEILSVCDGKVSLNEIMAYYTSTEIDEEQDTVRAGDFSDAQNVLQNIVRRIVRLYEHTLISW